MKRLVLLAGLLAGCATAAPEVQPAVPSTPAATTAPAVGAVGSASHALTRAATLGKPFRLIGKPGAWTVAVFADGATKTVAVTGEALGTPTPQTNPEFVYKPIYGEGLVGLQVDSDAFLARATQAGFDKYDRVLLLTGKEFTEYTSTTTSASLVWRVERSSSDFSIDAVTGKRIF